MVEHPKSNGLHDPLHVRGIIDLAVWQRIQDNFSSLTGVGLRTFDTEGKPITTPSGEPRLCGEVFKDLRAKDGFCGPCLPTFLGGRKVVDKNLSFTCPSWLHTFVAPLQASGYVFGYFLIGPVILVMRKPKEQYAQIAEEAGVELEEFWSALLELKVMSLQQAQSMVELVKDVGDYIMMLAYENRKVKREAMLSDSPKLRKLLEALMDVALQVSEADIGSIMFVDEKEKDVLTIRASRGLPEDVVKNTRVRLGDGISGLAAKERVALLIDEQHSDNRISSHLNRRYIKSSMVIPIKMDSRTVGIMNLGALGTSEVRFDADNLKVMNRLIDLATLAFRE